MMADQQRPAGRWPRRSALRLLGATPVTVGGILGTRDAERHGAARARGVADLIASGPEGISGGLLRYEQFLAQRAADDQFSGNIMLAYRGCPVFVRSYGMADRALGIPNRPGTTFGLASLGKIFTGIAAGQLAAAGKIDFYATVGTYLDGFPAPIADVVTVHQMFTHTSGLGNYQANPVWQQQAKTWSTPEQEFADTMAVIRDSPLLFAPGAAYGYSNSGYYTLGAIVARVSGLPFGDYVRAHIFGPAGMNHTNYYTTAQVLANPDIAHAYGPAQADGNRVDLTTRAGQIIDTGGGSGAGGGMSSAPDLLNLVLALGNGTLVNPAFSEVLTHGKYLLSPADLSDQPPSQSILSGYGFEERIVGNHRIFGHGGAAPVPGGIATDLSVYADLDWVGILLSNYYVDTRPYLQREDRVLTQRTTTA